jgi:hypothetical protein
VKKGFNYKKIVKITVLILFVVFVGIQFIPTTRNQSDKILETDFTKTFNVPNDIQNVIKTSCYDCHSNNTNYPWYNKLQPAAWFMEGHIADGKKELNFSEFGDYSTRRQKSKLKSIISQIRDDEMPLPSYLYIHWDAKLSVQEKKRLTDWITELRSGL